MFFNEYINSRRKALNMTIDELVERSGLPKGTVSKITSGENTNPKLQTIVALCRALSCSLDEASGLADERERDLTRGEREQLRRYRSLDSYGKSLMDSVLTIEYERCHPIVRMMTRPYYSIPVSAGFGNPLDEIPGEEMEITDTPEHRRGDFLVRISGNSMMPDYRDGDLVLVRKQETVEIGEIGIFVLNGESFIKKLGINELISLNPHYPSRPYRPSDSILCCGRVICKIE